MPIRLVIILMLVGLCSCSATNAPCRTTCSGCCDGSDQCQPGSSEFSCGQGGAECQACGLGTTCSIGSCVPTTGSGGGGSSTGGGAGGGDAGSARCVNEDDDARCGNGVDDDCDGFIDCRDFSCSRNPSVTACPCVPTGAETTASACADGVDNDCNGFVDCRDFSCSRNNPNVPACCPNREPENTAEACTDGVDNDCNGFADCRDFACSRNGALAVCDAGVSCVPTGAENTAAACANGRDEDCDGYIDCSDFNCAGTTPCPVGSLAACASCDAGADCRSGRCSFYTAVPNVKFCSQSCTADGGAPCPSTMVCNAQGSCVPKRSLRCSADAGAVLSVDDCGHTFGSTACTSSQVCVADAGTASCRVRAGVGGACALCRFGSECASGLCVVGLLGEPVGYCTQPCTLYRDCIQPGGAEPFDACLGGYCRNMGYGIDRTCSSDRQTVLRVNACGAVLERTACTGGDRCGRSRPTTTYPAGSTVCLSPCDYLNGCDVAGCCYLTYSSVSGQCCGLCSGRSYCTSP